MNVYLRISNVYLRISNQYYLVELIKIFHQGKVRGSHRTSTGSHMKTLRTEHVYISAVCCWRHSFMRPAQFYETGTVLWDRHRDRINRVINVQVNISLTQTFPTMSIENCQIFTIFTGWLLLETRVSQENFFLKFLFKLLKNIPWKYPFVSFLCQKSPVQKSKFCNNNFWIGNDPPSELFRKFIRFGRGILRIRVALLVNKQDVD